MRGMHGEQEALRNAAGGAPCIRVLSKKTTMANALRLLQSIFLSFFL
jgi:hypothetical protein